MDPHREPFIANTLLLAINLPLAPLWAKLLRIPRPILYACILFFAVLGAYAADPQTLSVLLLVIIGAVGLVARRYGYPVLPLIVGAILGPTMELQLRRALQISQGDPSILVSEPVAVVVYLLLADIIVAGALFRRRRARRGREELQITQAVKVPADQL